MLLEILTNKRTYNILIFIYNTFYIHIYTYIVTFDDFDM